MTLNDHIKRLSFRVGETRRKVHQLSLMKSEFERMIDALNIEIATAERRSGISDPTNFAYPTYAKAASDRRDKLSKSIADLMAQSKTIDIELASLVSEVANVEAVRNRHITVNAVQETELISA